MARAPRIAVGALAGLALVLGALIPSPAGSASGRRESVTATRAPVKHPRLSTNLARLARMTGDQSVEIEIGSARPDRVRALVRRLGGRVTISYGSLVEASVPQRSLAALGRAGVVSYAREPIRAVPDDVRGEGVRVTGATAWHDAGLLGAGTRIAVLDLGFAGWRASRKNGDLPASTIAVNLCPGRFDGVEAISHGTAVAEIVAEMAPRAQLYLICAQTVPALGAAKDYAKARGIQIINHSASWFNTSRGDDSGDPASPTGIVADARAAGILWVNAAGNRAQQHWSGTFTDADGDGAHEFAPGDEGNTVVVPGGTVMCVALKWDSWPVTAVDYDLELRLPNERVVAVSANQQNGTQPPTERVCYSTFASQTLAIVIRGQTGPGPDPRLDLFVYPKPNLEHRVPSGSVTEPGSSSFALTVGAVCWRTDALETFSGQGPTIDGRTKPDLSAPDYVSSFAYGRFRGCEATTGFVGTSASAPHVAGAAALIKSLNPSFGPSELQAYLEGHALDLGDPGRDSLYGTGKLSLGPSPRPPLRVCVVPRVAGLTLAQARARLSRAGCSVGRVRTTRSRARRGRVIAQSVRAGRRVSLRTRVGLTVSRGRRR